MAIKMVLWASVKYALGNRQTAILDDGWVEIDQEAWVRGPKYVVWKRDENLIDPKTGEASPMRWSQEVAVDELVELKCWLMENGYLLPG